jgi:hypothetical protein
MNLSRNPATGKILNDPTGGTPEDRRPIVLRGGHYHLFEKNNTAWRGFARPDNNVPFEVTYNGPPCPTNPAACPTAVPNQRAKALTWTGENNWKRLFDTLQNDTNCNLLRVWVMGGTGIYPPTPGEGPFDLYPFVAAKDGGVWKWKVYHAVGVAPDKAEWNENFFTRLADFVDEANRRGVCVQLTLFNFFDFDDVDADRFKAWSASAWNPAMSFDPPGQRGWGLRNLVNPGIDTPSERNKFFIKQASDSALRTVQTRLVAKIVGSLRNRNNVIFEVMNEPRQASAEELSRFNSDMVAAIDAAAGGSWRPLVSVNASQLPGRPSPEGVEFDTDWWRANSATVGRFDRVDILSYHALTGYESYAAVQGCGKSLSVPHTEPFSIPKRVRRHKNTQLADDKKALMFSTDAAVITYPEDGKTHTLTHDYCDSQNAGAMISMSARDGQIDTGLDATQFDLLADLTPEAEARLENDIVTRRQTALKSDLGDWAYWCFKLALANNGLVHFQNHSSFRKAFEKIFEAWRQAGGPVE